MRNENFAKTLLWMFLGLLVSGLTSWMVYAGGMTALFLKTPVLISLIIAEIIMVIAITFIAERVSTPIAGILFLLFACINGLTLSAVFLLYKLSIILVTFFVTSAVFFVAGVVGYYTNKDLTSFGGILFMALLGILICSVVNIFIQSSMFDWIVTLVSIVVFIGFTAYDIQNAKFNRMSPINSALALYLDYINLFINILKIVGSLSSSDDD